MYMYELRNSLSTVAIIIELHELLFGVITDDINISMLTKQLQWKHSCYIQPHCIDLPNHADYHYHSKQCYKGNHSYSNLLLHQLLLYLNEYTNLFWENVPWFAVNPRNTYVHIIIHQYIFNIIVITCILPSYVRSN